MTERYMLVEGRDGRWWVWDRVHGRPDGPGRTLEEADRAVEERNAVIGIALRNVWPADDSCSESHLPS
jgi:hypothetical protein